MFTVAADRHFAQSTLACVVAILAAAVALDANAANVELTTSTLPRFDAGESAIRSSRVDVLLMPERRFGIGIAMGINNPSGAHAFGGVAPLPSFDLGLHWRYTLDSHYRFDVTAYLRVPNTDAMSLIENRDPAYGARVEMGLGSGPRKGFVADRGFVGFQLESGARVTVRRSGGVPMLYYRNSF